MNKINKIAFEELSMEHTLKFWEFIYNFDGIYSKDLDRLYKQIDALIQQNSIDIHKDIMQIITEEFDNRCKFNVHEHVRNNYPTKFIYIGRTYFYEKYSYVLEVQFVPPDYLPSVLELFFDENDNKPFIKSSFRNHYKVENLEEFITIILKYKYFLNLVIS
jgi:hypothetical protein